MGMTKTTITDAEFDLVQGKIDDLTRKTRRGRRGTPEDIAAYNTVYPLWEAAYAMPQRTVDDRAAREAALVAVATQAGLL